MSKWKYTEISGQAERLSGGSQPPGMRNEFRFLLHCADEKDLPSGLPRQVPGTYSCVAGGEAARFLASALESGSRMALTGMLCLSAKGDEQEPIRGELRIMDFILLPP